MKELTLDALKRRLDGLERENRWMKRIGAVIIMVFAVMLIMGQAGPSKVAKVIEAERVVLRTSRGNVRAMLGVAEDDTTFFRFYDKEGRPRIAMSLAANSDPIFSLAYKDGKPAVVLSEVLNKTGLRILDRGGNSSLSLVLDPSGLALFSLAHNDKVRIALTATGDHSQLSLFDADEKTKVTLTENGARHSGLVLSDNEKPRVVLGSSEAESFLTLFNKEGNVMWRAP